MIVGKANRDLLNVSLIFMNRIMKNKKENATECMFFDTEQFFFDERQGYKVVVT